MPAHQRPALVAVVESPWEPERIQGQQLDFSLNGARTSHSRWNSLDDVCRQGALARPRDSLENECTNNPIGIGAQFPEIISQI